MAIKKKKKIKRKILVLYSSHIFTTNLLAKIRSIQNYESEREKTYLTQGKDLYYVMPIIAFGDLAGTSRPVFAERP